MDSEPHLTWIRPDSIGIDDDEVLAGVIALVAPGSKLPADGREHKKVPGMPRLAVFAIPRPRVLTNLGLAVDPVKNSGGYQRAALS